MGVRATDSQQELHGDVMPYFQYKLIRKKFRIKRVVLALLPSSHSSLCNSTAFRTVTFAEATYENKISASTIR